MSNLSLDFTGVEESNGPAYLTPGVHVVRITKTEVGTSSQKGTPLLAVFFETENGSTYREDFYLSKGALPRIQHLVSQFAGKSLTGDITTNGINAMLVGKQARIILDGEKKYNQNGEVKTYATLRFAGFAQPLSAAPFLAQEVKIADKTSDVKAVANTVAVSDDLPF